MGEERDADGLRGASYEHGFAAYGGCYDVNVRVRTRLDAKA